MSNVKTIFISGASRGIGAATAKRFAREGYSIVLTYNARKFEAETVAEECKKLGAPETLVLELNLKTDESIVAAVKSVREKFGSIDILINNAAVSRVLPIAQQSFSDIHEQIAANLEGMIKLTHEFLPETKEAIINVGSRLGLIAKKKLSVYVATKWGLRGFTRSIAKEFPTLRIYAVNPGSTNTEMGNPDGMPPEKVAEVIFQAAVGSYNLKNGSDVNVKYYTLGPGSKVIYSLKELIKKVLGR